MVLLYFDVGMSVGHGGGPPATGPTDGPTLVGPAYLGPGPATNLGADKGPATGLEGDKVAEVIGVGFAGTVGADFVGVGLAEIGFAVAVGVGFVGVVGANLAAVGCGVVVTGLLVCGREEV